MATNMGSERQTLAPRRTRRSLDAALAAVGRAVAALARLTGRGAGTSLPGRIVDTLSPGFLARQAARLPRGSIVVAGTNGKTTTASMLRSILRTRGWRIVGNSSGANLRRGLVAAFLHGTGREDAGLFEVDEAALPSVIGAIRPRLLILTNVFRDQLDRFAEPERVARLLRRAAEALPGDARILANADDPVLWAAIEDLRPIGFSVRTDAPLPAPAVAYDADPDTCPRCGGRLDFERRTMANLGVARCETCRWRSTAARYVGRLVSQAGLGGSVVEFEDEILTVPLGGLHNVYNATAALAASRELGVSTTAAASALEEFHARFGRAEDLLFEDRHLWMALVKNPAGAGVVIQQVSSDRRVGAVVVAISDRDADGRDVSWIWDADMERLATLRVPIIAAGTRAPDVAVRLKYAGRLPAGVRADPLAAVRMAVARCGPDRIVAVLATYTAMLDVREALLGDHAARVEDVA